MSYIYSEKIFACHASPGVLHLTNMTVSTNFKCNYIALGITRLRFYLICQQAFSRCQVFLPQKPQFAQIPHGFVYYDYRSLRFRPFSLLLTLSYCNLIIFPLASNVATSNLRTSTLHALQIQQANQRPTSWRLRYLKELKLQDPKTCRQTASQTSMS